MFVNIGKILWIIRNLWYNSNIVKEQKNDIRFKEKNINYNER